MVPTCTPLRRQVLRSSAAWIWSFLSGINIGKTPESLDDLILGLWLRKTLKQFLQHQTSGEDGVTSLGGATKFADLGCSRRSIAPHRQ